MAYRIQRLIQYFIQSNPDSLGAVINKTQSDFSNFTKRIYSYQQFLFFPNKRQVISVITSTANKFIISQVVHYNFVKGYLLINRKPLRRLLLDIKESKDIKELFGNQYLLTFPLLLSDISYVIATRIRGNKVYFGLRERSIVIRALIRDSLLKYIPRRIFTDSNKFNLPLGLIGNYVY